MGNETFSSQCREDGSITVSSGKRLTIENAADFAKCITEALATSNRVEVEFDEKLEADVTALQILCSACKTAAVKRNTFTHHGPQTKSMRELIAKAGAERLGPCSHNHGNLCIWFGGQENGKSNYDC